MTEYGDIYGADGSPHERLAGPVPPQPALRHVPRVEVTDKLRRLNELERVIPIYRAALELIAHTGGAGQPSARIAEQALREADRTE